MQAGVIQSVRRREKYKRRFPLDKNREGDVLIEKGYPPLATGDVQVATHLPEKRGDFMNDETGKTTRILIIYDSGTGNTEKMALAVAEGARKVTTAVIVKRADAATVDDMLEADGIILGSPTYYGLMSANIKKLFDISVKIHGKLSGKVGAAFTSAGGTATGAETTLLSIVEGLLIHGMIVQGRSDNKHYGVACTGPPDEKGITFCRELGERTASLANRLV